jgi:ATP-dependent Clp protease adaptor protein ClpS
MNDTGHKTLENVSSRTELTEPPQYKVLLLNDNFTTMDFVVNILETVFNKSPSEAIRIMLNVHKKGMGICGIYTHEIAETKVAIVEDMAKNNNFPLKCNMEIV